MHSMNFAATAGDYYAQANDDILVVLQTESPRGVENAEAIYSLPGVDAIFIGPNDLRFQMRTPDGTFPTAEAARGDDPAGHRGRQEGRNARPAFTRWTRRTPCERAEQGMQFIAVGSDLRMMTQKAQETLDVLQAAERRRRIWRGTSSGAGVQPAIELHRRQARRLLHECPSISSPRSTPKAPKRSFVREPADRAGRRGRSRRYELRRPARATADRR